MITYKLRGSRRRYFLSHYETSLRKPITKTHYENPMRLFQLRLSTVLLLMTMVAFLVSPACHLTSQWIASWKSPSRLTMATSKNPPGRITVKLPILATTTVSTVVSVPDVGRAWIGGRWRPSSTRPIQVKDGQLKQAVKKPSTIELAVTSPNRLPVEFGFPANNTYADIDIYLPEEEAGHFNCSGPIIFSRDGSVRIIDGRSVQDKDGQWKNNSETRKKPIQSKR